VALLTKRSFGQFSSSLGRPRAEQAATDTPLAVGGNNPGDGLPDGGGMAVPSPGEPTSVVPPLAQPPAPPPAPPVPGQTQPPAAVAPAAPPVPVMPAAPPAPVPPAPAPPMPPPPLPKTAASPLVEAFVAHCRGANLTDEQFRAAVEKAAAAHPLLAEEFEKTAIWPWLLGHAARFLGGRLLGGAATALGGAAKLAPGAVGRGLGTASTAVRGAGQTVAAKGQALLTPAKPLGLTVPLPKTPDLVNQAAQVSWPVSPPVSILAGNGARDVTSSVGRSRATVNSAVPVTPSGPSWAGRHSNELMMGGMIGVPMGIEGVAAGRQMGRDQQAAAQATQLASAAASGAPADITTFAQQHALPPVATTALTHVMQFPELRAKLTDFNEAGRFVAGLKQLAAQPGMTPERMQEMAVNQLVPGGAMSFPGEKAAASLPGFLRRALEKLKTVGSQERAVVRPTGPAAYGDSLLTAGRVGLRAGRKGIETAKRNPTLAIGGTALAIGGTALAAGATPLLVGEPSAPAAAFEAGTPKAAVDLAGVPAQVGGALSDAGDWAGRTATDVGQGAGNLLSRIGQGASDVWGSLQPHHKALLIGGGGLLANSLLKNTTGYGLGLGLPGLLAGVGAAGYGLSGGSLDGLAGNAKKLVGMGQQAPAPASTPVAPAAPAVAPPAAEPTGVTLEQASAHPRLSRYFTNGKPNFRAVVAAKDDELLEGLKLLHPAARQQLREQVAAYKPNWAERMMGAEAHQTRFGDLLTKAGSAKLEKFIKLADGREKRASDRLWRYQCPKCGSTNAYNGRPDGACRYRGSGECADCGGTFSIVGSGMKSIGQDGPLLKKSALISFEDLKPPQLATGERLDRGVPAAQPGKPKRGPAAEYCPHCDARLERGEDGVCNQCGKDWPEEQVKKATPAL